MERHEKKENRDLSKSTSTVPNFTNKEKILNGKNDPMPRNTLVDLFCFEDNKVNLGSGAWIVILWILLAHRNATNNN